jgi:hypothetical protein
VFEWFELKANVPPTTAMERIIKNRMVKMPMKTGPPSMKYRVMAIMVLVQESLT